MTDYPGVGGFTLSVDPNIMNLYSTGKIPKF